MGIRLHLLSGEVIEAVGNVFGKVIHRASRSDEDINLSYDYIGVLVGEGKRIGEEVKLSWNDRKFLFWVSEESGEWVPEFYKVSKPMPENGSSPEDVEVNNGETDNLDDEEITSDSEEVPVVPDDDRDDVATENVVNDMETVVNIDEGIIPPINVEEITEIEGDFIPGNLFNFEKGGQENVEVEITGLVNKRKKKSMLGSVGRPNPAYSSSLEKTKIRKKPKCNEDPFGLDPLLGIEPEGYEEDHRTDDSLSDWT
ncbi:hypothetical protein Hdeb2414_s0124g00804571 [Helianthus debilis subsp. tardiflorus]